MSPTRGGSLKRLVIAITGATGAIYGIRLLEMVRRLHLAESHLILSRLGMRTITTETDYSLAEVKALAQGVYDNADLGAPPASGSFRTLGMIVAPCSVKTLSALAQGYSDTLIARAGDVTLKEGRPLAVLFRETPLHVGHLRQMLALAEMGAILMPPVPAFYTRPATIGELVDHTVARLLQRLGLVEDAVPEWSGHAPRSKAAWPTPASARPAPARRRRARRSR